ncbi:MAG: carboxypeptidase regulatory-like domain-containing protein [Planctomycetota bacterium]
MIEKASSGRPRRGFPAVVGTLVLSLVAVGLVALVGRSGERADSTAAPTGTGDAAPAESASESALEAPAPRVPTPAPLAVEAPRALPDAAEPSAAVPSTARVLGRVVRADGAGVADVAILLAGAGGDSRTTTSGFDGLFELVDVAPGEHSLVLGAGDEPFLAPKPVVIEAPTTHLTDCVLPEFGTLEVRVVDELGRPVPDAHVECRGHPRGQRTAVTDLTGHARFFELPPGEGRVFANQPPLGRGNLPFAIEAGETTSIELLLIGRGADRETAADAFRSRAGATR